LIGARQASTALQPFGEHASTPKIRAVVNDIESGIKNDPNFKGVVYSDFLQGGLTPLAAKLKRRNISYGMFTGEQSDIERNQMVRDYNKGKLKSLLISPAGGEGLDLKGSKYLGILNPSWNPAKTDQVIGRVARFKSHEHLPESERNVVVKQYLSEPRLGLLGKLKKLVKPSNHMIGVDEYVWNRSQEKKALNNQFTNALKGNANE
jgi:superfamily II DNA/RNA helicase